MGVKQEQVEFEVAMYIVHCHYKKSFTEIAITFAKDLVYMASRIPEERISVGQMRDIFIIRQHGLDYLLEKKYVSICSEDRNIMKYPNPSTFEIELPQDYLNVQSVKLHSWSFYQAEHGD